MQSSISSPSPVRTRWPSRTELLQVFGVVLFAVFGWAIRGFFYKLPSFTLYFGLGANLAILCYMFAFALVESALLIGLLWAFSALLPRAWLRQGFVYKSFLIVLVASVGMIVFQAYYKEAFFKDILAGQTYPYPPFIIGTLILIVALGALLWAAGRHTRLRKWVEYAAEQMSLFTYIYVPLGVIGLVVVLIRNL